MGSRTGPTRIKVRGYHCDLYGHVNNARYLEFLEAARWDLLEGGIDLETWHERGWRFVIVNVSVDYRASATLGDELLVSARPGELGNASARIHQEIVRARDGATVAEATITFVVMDEGRGKPLPLRGELADQLRALAAGRDLPDGEET